MMRPRCGAALVLVCWWAAAPAVGAAAQTPATSPASRSELEGAAAREPHNAALQVALGITYWAEHEYARALAAFERAVQVDASSAEAHNWLGVARMAQSDLAGAASALRRAIALDPGHGRAHANLGAVLVKSSDFTEAIQVFQKALALEPGSLTARMNLGMAMRDAGDLNGALEHLRHVAAADPAYPGIHYELGQASRQNGDLSDAVAAFDRALAADPESREGYYALGMALRQQSARARKGRTGAEPSADPLHAAARGAIAQGNLTNARARLEEIVRASEADAEAHMLLGFVIGQQGDLPSALAHLQRAAALQPDAAEARYNLGVALWYSGSRAAALTELRESVTLDPAAGGSYAFLGMALREAGDLEGARASLQRAIALLPPTAAVFIDLGITYLRAGDLDKAIGQLEAGLNLAPALPAPDWSRAAADLRRALAAQAGRADAFNVLGRLLGRQGADERTVADAFREAARLQPAFAEAHNNLGLVLIQAGDDQGGIAALREAVRLSPDYSDALANLGAALTPIDADEAIRHLERAVTLAPGSIKAQFNLAMAYGASPRAGPARELEQLRKVIALDPAFPRAYLALGKAHLRDDRVTEAVDALREGARLEPANGEVRYQLGLALARAGRKEEAAAELQKGRDLVAAGDRAQQATLDIAEGRAALERGDLDGAVGRLRRAIATRPESLDARRHLAEALERQGETVQAAEAYRAILELHPNDVRARERLEALTPRPTDGDDRDRMAALEEYIRRGEFAQVEPLLAEYVTERPTSAWGWYALGYSRFAQQKIGGSIEALAKSLQLDIRNADAHKILGRNLMIIGRFDAAQVEFEEALKYRPDSAELHYNLGRLFSIQDNWEPARRAFEAAVRLDPSYLEAIDGLGFALEALGDDAGAVAHYERAATINAARGGAAAAPLVNLSAYYNRTEEPARALEYADAAVALDPRSDRAWFQKGRAEERLGRLDTAAESINRAIVLNQRASSYYYVLAGLYRRLGWMEESRQALEAFKRLDRESADLEKQRRGTRSAPASGQQREDRE